MSQSEWAHLSEAHDRTGPVITGHLHSGGGAIPDADRQAEGEVELACIPSPPLPSGMGNYGKTDKRSRQTRKEARPSGAPPRHESTEQPRSGSERGALRSLQLWLQSQEGNFRHSSLVSHSSLVTRHSESTEISHSPLFFVLYILGPRQSSRCSERVEQAQDSGPSADKCDRVGICSPKCLATKPKTEAASSPKVPDSWRRVRSSGKQPHGLIHVSRAL